MKVPKEIISVQNERVKLWASLLEKKQRDKQLQYLIEGVHLVQEALLCHAAVETVVFSLDRGLPDEIAQLVGIRDNVELIGVSEAVLAKCTDAETPQSVCAVVRKPGAKINTDALPSNEVGRPALWVAVDGLQDPGNLGTIIRSADAVGASGVIIGKGSADVYNPKTVRSTMGSLFHLPVVEGDLLQLLPLLREQSVRTVCASLQAEHSCYETNLSSPVCIIIGNEARGVSEEVRNLVDEHLIIPMPGRAESLNAAMAATVLLFEALRQRL